MRTVLNGVLQANAQYGANIDNCDLPVPPGRHFGTLSCMDAGLPEGNASDDAMMTDLLSKGLTPAFSESPVWQDSGVSPGSTEGKYISWLTSKDQAKSVQDDVLRIKSYPLVPEDIPVYDYNNDVKSGRLLDIPATTETGGER